MKRKKKTFKRLKKRERDFLRRRRWKHFKYRQRDLRDRFVSWVGKIHDQCCEQIAIWQGQPLHTFLIYLEQNDGAGFIAMWKDGKCFQAHSGAWAARQARDEAWPYGVAWTQQRFSHPRTFVYVYERDTLWKIPEGRSYPGLTPYRVFPSHEEEEYQDTEESDEIPGNYSIIWNGEAAMLLNVCTPEQQREEWQYNSEGIESWYETGEDEEPTFEAIYTIIDSYGVSHEIVGEKKFRLIQQGYFWCVACGQVQPPLLLAKTSEGDCTCLECLEQSETR